MSLREKINSRAGLAVVAVVVIGATVAFAVIARGMFRGVDHYEVGNWLYFIDEETREVSIHPASDVSPQVSASGKPTVVRACFFSGDGGKTMRPVYLLKYSAEGKKRFEEARGNMKKDELYLNARLLPEDMLVRAAETGSQWVPEGSEQGRVIRMQANGLAGASGRVIECYPKSASDTVPVVK